MCPSYVAKVTCNIVCAWATWPKLRASSICFETVGHRRWKEQPIKPLSAAERLKMSRIDKRKSISREMVGRFNTTVRSALTDEVCVSDTKCRWRFSRWFEMLNQQYLTISSQLYMYCANDGYSKEYNSNFVIWETAKTLTDSFLGFFPDCVFYQIWKKKIVTTSNQQPLQLGKVFMAAFLMS